MRRKLNSATVYIDDAALEVKFYFYPGQSAKLSGPWELCYPEEPAEIEIESITTSGNIFELLLDSEKVIERIEDYILSNHDD